MNVLNKARVCECLPGHYSLTPPLPSLHQVLLSLLLELKGETSDKEYDSTLERALRIECISGHYLLFSWTAVGLKWLLLDVSPRINSIFLRLCNLYTVVTSR